MAGIGYGRRRQADIYLAGVRGQKPLVPQSAAALEQEAERARKASPTSRAAQASRRR